MKDTYYKHCLLTVNINFDYLAEVVLLKFLYHTVIFYAILYIEVIVCRPYLRNKKLYFNLPRLMYLLKLFTLTL